MLKKLGVGPLDLKNFCDTAKKHGGMNRMVNAINSFENLRAIQDEVIKMSGQKEEVQKKIDRLKLEIKELEDKKEGFRRPLRLYDDLRVFGFDVETLASLSYICQKFNSSARLVLEAVRSFGDLTEIKQEVEKAKARRIEEEKLLNEAKQQRSHFKDVLNMCNELQNSFKFTVSAIQELLNIAQKYGTPLEVIKAVEKYGGLKGLEAEIEKLSEEKVKLASAIEEMHRQLQGLQATAETIRESAKGLLQPLSIELTKTVENTFQKITSVYSESFSIMKKQSEEYAKRLAEAKIFQEELNLARVINAMIKYPAEAKNLTIDYPLLLIDAVEKYCFAKGINPQISLREASIAEEPVASTHQVQLQQLIYGVKTALYRGYVRISS